MRRTHHLCPGFDQTWEEFRRTFVCIETGAGVLEVRPAGLADRGPYLAGQAGPLHSVTACNPQGKAASAAANEAANARLRGELVARGLELWPTTGHGTEPEGAASGWCEPGFTVAGLTLPEALELGRRYDQAAIFAWRNEPGGFRLVSCDGSVDEPRGWIACLG